VRCINARILGVLIAIFAVCTAHAADRSGVITQARSAHQVTQSEAGLAHPVHLRATVTYYDAHIDRRHAAMFVCDRSGCIFVRISQVPESPFHVGDLIEVEGVTAPGDYAPVIDPTRIKVVGRGSLPAAAIKATVPLLLSGSLDGQWVEVEGVVHAVHGSQTNVTVDIATPQGTVSAISVREDGKNYEALIDALVRLRGNAAPMFNRKRQLAGVHLFFPSLKTVEVLRPAPADPFAVPMESVADLLQFAPGVELRHRVRVQGRVTLAWPGRMLCIQQSSDGMCVQATQRIVVRPGELVDVIGFPAVSNFKPTLEDVSFRISAGAAKAVAASPLTAAQAVDENHDGELVQIEGELLGQDRATGDLTLMLRAGKFLIPAILPYYSGSSASVSWTDGSRIQVTGICNVQVNSDSTNDSEGAVRPDSVQILLRTPNDIRILATPSWWTARNALAVLSLVGLLAFGAFAWVINLRQRVEHQTQELRRSEERLRHMSQHDSLTELPNRILMNDRLAMALHRMERFHGILALLMIDLDRFKEVNDTLGHHAGDQVLCEVAQRICRLVRQTDTVARLGGDEFIVILPDLHESSEAEGIAAKVVAAISEPIKLGGEYIDISASVGVCTAPQSGVDAERLLQAVDHAMYGAKARGKNCYHVEAGQWIGRS
jgi:diguanylate cyclase (GGDEF)-like protein